MKSLHDFVCHSLCNDCLWQWLGCWIILVISPKLRWILFQQVCWHCIFLSEMSQGHQLVVIRVIAAHFDSCGKLVSIHLPRKNLHGLKLTVSHCRAVTSQCLMKVCCILHVYVMNLLKTALLDPEKWQSLWFLLSYWQCFNTNCKPGKFCGQEIFAVFAVGSDPQKLSSQNIKYYLTSLKNYIGSAKLKKRKIKIFWAIS